MWAFDNFENDIYDICKKNFLAICLVSKLSARSATVAFSSLSGCYTSNSGEIFLLSDFWQVKRIIHRFSEVFDKSSLTYIWQVNQSLHRDCDKKENFQSSKIWNMTVNYHIFATASVCSIVLKFYYEYRWKLDKLIFNFLLDTIFGCHATTKGVVASAQLELQFQLKSKSSKLLVFTFATTLHRDNTKHYPLKRLNAPKDT